MKSFVFFSFSNLVIVVFSDALPAMFHQSEGLFFFWGGGQDYGCPWLVALAAPSPGINRVRPSIAQTTGKPFLLPLGVRPHPTEGPSSDQLLFSHRVTLDGE